MSKLNPADSAARAPAPAWNPYIAGLLAGGALALSYFFSDQGFGATPFYGFITRAFFMLVNGEGLTATDQLGRPELRPTWHVLFALGIPAGAFLAGLLYNDLKWEAVPRLWEQRFGPGRGRRALWAFIGAALAMVGVRLAMGCPSGLGLSGMAVLSAGGFIGMAGFFIGGGLMARLVWARRSAGEGEDADR